jgi:hypothetical protein
MATANAVAAFVGGASYKVLRRRSVDDVFVRGLVGAVNDAPE